ncbi:hypothetical protein E1176_08005 [Fulvivirga sp. RKSG066]|uniref:hypothetical protein n=1 Tax=Fulvivirga aurantia TaxID=2529383 RepID=UPI0012BD1372|nr:hypothetical protein [Fulvivirga aurantia]MTI20962.1 hypothetical protein [Fulvivirga aurantia]
MIKNTTLCFLVFLTVQISIPSFLKAQQSIDPQEAGKKVFDLLSKFDNITESKFVKKMMRHNELQSLVKHYNITDEQQKEQIMQMPKERWESMALNDHRGIAYFSENADIVWEKIKFARYKYELEQQNGLEIYRGLLVFTYNDEEYDVEIKSVIIRNDIKLVRLSPPQEVFKY